jgi:hypothetical protein
MEFLSNDRPRHEEWVSVFLFHKINERGCAIRRGGGCNCVPEVFLKMPDGALAEIDAGGRVRKESRH